MAKKIAWSVSSIKDRADIYEFWELHNKSNAYSEKLESLFEEVANLISAFPEVGVRIHNDDLRVKVMKYYKIFYRETPDRIEIIRIWDTRQDPETFKLF